MLRERMWFLRNYQSVFHGAPPTQKQDWRAAAQLSMTMGGSASHHAEREAVDFSTSLLWFHLGRSPPAVLASGEVANSEKRAESGRPDSALFPSSICFSFTQDEVDGVETDGAAVTTLTAAQDSDQPSATRVSSKVQTSYGVAS